MWMDWVKVELVDGRSDSDGHGRQSRRQAWLRSESPAAAAANEIKSVGPLWYPAPSFFRQKHPPLILKAQQLIQSSKRNKNKKFDTEF